MIPSLRRPFYALTAMVLLASPAAAQMPHINMMPDAKSRTPEEIERDEKLNKAYKESLRKIPDAKGASDPWGDVRGAEAAPKAPAKPKQAGTASSKRAN